MPINLGVIDGQIRRLQTIRALLSDPEAVRLIEQALVHRQSVTRQVVPAGQFSHSRAVWRCIAAMPGQFTVETVGQSLRAGGSPVKHPTISRIISQLVKRGRVRIVERGSGRKPNVCERIPLE